MDETDVRFLSRMRYSASYMENGLRNVPCEPFQGLIAASTEADVDAAIEAALNKLDPTEDPENNELVNFLVKKLYEVYALSYISGLQIAARQKKKLQKYARNGGEEA